MEIHGLEDVSEERRTETDRLYEEAKVDYMITTCKACSTTRLNHTWSKLDVVHGKERGMAVDTPNLRDISYQ